MDQRLIKERLCRRIAAILDRLDSEGRPPPLLEADGITKAIELTSAGRYDLATAVLDELRRLTTMSPWNSYPSPVMRESVTIEALRAKLTACSMCGPGEV